MKLFIFYISFLLFVTNNYAQKNNFSVWNTVQIPIQINKKLQVHNDISYRTLNFLLLHTNIQLEPVYDTL